MTYQPSPYQTQAPSFASPLDQIVNGVQPGASSSRGALLERAYSLTRGGGAGPSATKQDAHGAQTMTAAASMHSPPLPPPPSTYASVHTPLHNYRQSSGTGGDEGSGRHGMHNPSSVAAQQTSSSSSTSDRQRVQRLREARLSQQQTQSGAQQHNNALHGKQSNDAMLSKAFRDSVASDVSFNSITGLHDRTSMLNIGPAQSAWHGQRQQASEEYSDADRIAEEVRGLAMRRRPSIDTVRSSEFGEGGRWAKAWAGSDDGQDDEEEEEMDLQAMRARDITDYDVEGRRTPQQHIGGLGALGQLGSLQGARAAMISANGAVTSTRRSNDESPMPRLQNAPGSSHTVNLTPSNSHMRSVQHFHPSSQLSSPNQQLSHLVTPATATLNRRDTIMSVSGVIEEASVDDVSQKHLDQAHARSESNATVGSAASSALGNAHVMVWPPTPAGSAAGSSRGHGEFNDAIRRNSNRDTLRATPRAEMGVGQRAIVEHAEPQPEDQQNKNQHQQRALPQQYSQPISPSSLLNNQSSSNSIHITNSLAQQQPSRESPVRGSPVQHEESYTGYADPNQHTYAYASDGLGKMRRKAIADHDGRESMVSDLDVETLRLDGSSASGSSSDGYDPRRDSTSTIGTVTSIQLDEQRRRRSRLERHDAAAAGYDDRRSSVATIRGGGGAGQHFSSPRVNRQVDETLASARSMGNDGLAQRHNANMAVRPVQPPKRANSQPDEQAPQLAPAPWAAKSPTMYQQRTQQPMRSASGDSIRAGLTSPPMRTAPLGSPLTSAASATTSLLSSPLTSRTTSESSVHTMQKGQRNSAGASSSSLLSVQSQAEKFLTLGISHHESGDLSRSAYNFERSAKIDGGCVVGMCMWGMALREGWGVRKDQKRGFEWISRAASRAGEMMSSGGGTSGKASRTEAEVKAIRSELKLSVYELGKCFCYGWGVKMDKQMALEYFELAARLGDADAQAEAGALLAAGKGCKKDLKKAAMYYRMAEAQGYDTVGLSWIHKDKYSSGNAATSTASNLAAR